MHYVISDIHGHYTEFKKLMDEKVKFDYEKDFLICLGDILDRGKQNCELLEWFFNSPDNIILLKGNHEHWVWNYFSVYLKYYTNNIRPYHYNTVDQMREKYCEVDLEKYLKFLDELPLQVELELDGVKYRLAHGATKRDVDNFIVPDSYILPDNDWYIPHLEKKKYYEQDFISVVGHTSTNFLSFYNEHIKPGRIHKSHNCIFVDCGAAYAEEKNSNLGCLCLETNEEFYVPINLN